MYASQTDVSLPQPAAWLGHAKKWISLSQPLFLSDLKSAAWRHYALVELTRPDGEASTAVEWNGADLKAS